jgi:phage N-6-adenine-methyltransferase
VAFAKALAAAQERCIRVCEADKGSTEQRGASGTGENEWYTPGPYIEMAREVLGKIDLDPATNQHAQKWIKATRYFTKDNDGLEHPWTGRVWLNPPYMQPDIQQFVEKLVGEFQSKRTEAAILLTHNYTDTAWFHLAAGSCNAICFTRGRIRFIDTDGAQASPTQGQAYFYFVSDIGGFAKRFGEIGFIVTLHGRNN